MSAVYTSHPDDCVAGISRKRLERIPLDDLTQVYRMVASVYRLRTTEQDTIVSSRMAALPIGGSFVLPRTTYLTIRERAAARQRLGLDAQWSSRTTTKGLRITRTR